MKPIIWPSNPRFSSGPTTKNPEFLLENLDGAQLGRSHRSADGRRALKRAIEETCEILGIPDDYRIAITPGSDTGAVEMALWNLLGPRPVDVLSWDAFGHEWVIDAVEQLRLPSVRILQAKHGHLPDLHATNSDHDIVFTLNGTSAGVRIPDTDWIADTRAGLTICDATSAVFAQEIDWQKFDVTTFSWQKALGGEAGHGMIVMSPRAILRLIKYRPDRAIPKVFRLLKNNDLNEAFFEGETITTPSMLCVEDWLRNLAWARWIGGLPELCRRADANTAAVHDWIARTPWVEHLAEDPATRANTGVTIQFASDLRADMMTDELRALAQRMGMMLEEQGAAYDCLAYPAAPPGFRIWCGPTVETADVEAMLPWLDWAFVEAISAG